MDEPAKEMKRMVVGCDDDMDQGDAVSFGDEVLRAYKPISAVEILNRAQAVARDLFLTSSGNFGFTSGPAADDLPGLKLICEAPGTRLSEAAISTVDDHCDQLMYWGLYESRFPEEPSCICAETDALRVLLSMLVYSRSPVVLSALRVLEVLVDHPITAKYLARVPLNLLVQDEASTASATTDGAAVETHADPTDGVPRWVATDVFQLLFSAARQFPNKLELQVSVTKVARHLAPHTIERFLTADLVSAVLAAMKQHGKSAEVQREGVLLFAATVERPRDDAKDVPIAILFVHVGKIIDFVLAAALLTPTNSEVSSATAKIMLATSRHPENDDELGSTRCIQVLSSILKHHGRNSDLAIDTLSALAGMVRWMDHLQRRTLVLTVREVMMRVTDAAVLTTCCAVLHVAHDQYDREMLAVATVAPQEVETHALESAIESLGMNLEALREHTTKAKIPQLVHIVLEHFGEESSDLVETANLALGSMVLKRPPTLAQLRLRVEREAATDDTT